MDSNQLYSNILKKKSFLCIGLDTNIDLIPSFLKGEEFPIFAFNKAIIDATAHLAVAYKPNLAFYEAQGADGWRQLEMTISYIREVDPSIFIIADAKRGDIGNTAERYAEAFFGKMNCDAVTISPYMGRDSVDPFLKYKDKWAIVLALTSNPSATDFQTKLLAKEEQSTLYRYVIETSATWGSPDNLMYVVGATRAQELAKIREYAPHHFFLVPGVGAQGGSLTEVATYGMNSKCGLLVNASRDILFAWQKSANPNASREFALEAQKRAQEIVSEMSKFL